jgi:hypothetical protein
MSDSEVRTLSEKVSRHAEVEGKYALMAISAAQNVKFTQSDARMKHYRSLLPRERAVEWLLDRWSKNSYRK